MTSSYQSTVKGSEFPTLVALDVFTEIMKDFGKFQDPYPKSVYPYNIKTIDNGKTSIIEFALAGWNKDEIKVSIKCDELIVEAKSSEDNSKPKDGEIYLQRRIAKRSFKEVFVLNGAVNKTAITSTYVDGLLTITLPIKAEEIAEIEIK